MCGPQVRDTLSPPVKYLPSDTKNIEGLSELLSTRRVTDGCLDGRTDRQTNGAFLYSFFGA